MQKNIRRLTRAALIAAIYVLFTVLLQAISFGPLQFRVSEMLMTLPVLFPEAPYGLFCGCLIANLLGGGVWYDVVFGSVATLLSALLVRIFRKKPLLAVLMPVLLNGLIVGCVVYFAYIKAPGAPANAALLLSAMGMVALGEAVVCYALGLPLIRFLRSLPPDALRS